MKFDIFVPTRIISGVGCIKDNKDKLLLGRRAYIVTGKSGAKKSGALDGITAILAEAGVEYRHFDGCRENPRLLDCYAAGKDAAAFGADFVIGIGGGSAIDSAKAVAMFAAHPEMEAEEIFAAPASGKKPLPLVAVATTSGTGSEANGISVMTLPNGVSKKSFIGAVCWPTVSFIDPAYTYSLPRSFTVSCALDAFAHAAESYLSPKSTEFSRLCATYAAKNIWSILKNCPDEFTPDHRAALQNSSTAAGIAISVTGTGFPHPLGYSITMLDGVPHGAACAIFYGAYIGYNMKTEQGRALVESFCRAIDATPDELAKQLPRLSGVELSFTEAQIEERVDLIKGAKNYVNSPYVLNDREKTEIYRELFGEKK
ncbi:MAG: iron-containing alcohol dehydrogenase [Clostridia bacterium]|nr:iron-containing alcohol dehydrogenase [Clostridia bacterium]